MSGQNRIGDVKQQLGVGPILIDTEASCVYKNGIELELTAREYGVLRYLAENSNIILKVTHSLDAASYSSRNIKVRDGQIE